MHRHLAGSLDSDVNSFVLNRVTEDHEAGNGRDAARGVAYVFGVGTVVPGSESGPLPEMVLPAISDR